MQMHQQAIFVVLSVAIILGALAVLIAWWGRLQEKLHHQRAVGGPLAPLKFMRLAVILGSIAVASLAAAMVFGLYVVLLATPRIPPPVDGSRPDWLARIPDLPTQERRHTEILAALKGLAGAKPTATEDASPLASFSSSAFAVFAAISLVSGAAYLLVDSRHGKLKNSLRITTAASLLATLGFSVIDKFNAVEKLSMTLLSLNYYGGTKPPPIQDPPSPAIAPTEFSWSCLNGMAVGPFVQGSSTTLEPGFPLDTQIQTLATYLADPARAPRIKLLLLVGSTDNQGLRNQMRSTFESNAGLGQARAGEVDRLLREKLEHMKTAAPAQAVLLSAGPRQTLSIRGKSPQEVKTLRQSDRVVRLCVGQTETLPVPKR